MERACGCRYVIPLSLAVECRRRSCTLIRHFLPQENHPRLPEFVPVICRSCLRAISFCIFFSSAAAAMHAQTKPLTISAIFNDPGLTADAPRGMEWSPDGLRLTYLNGD